MPRIITDACYHSGRRSSSSQQHSRAASATACVQSRRGFFGSSNLEWLHEWLFQDCSTRVLQAGCSSPRSGPGHGALKLTIFTVALIVCCFPQKHRKPSAIQQLQEARRQGKVERKRQRDPAICACDEECRGSELRRNASGEVSQISASWLSMGIKASRGALCKCVRWHRSCLGLARQNRPPSALPPLPGPVNPGGTKTLILL
jgi:hypothetical protein